MILPYLIPLSWREIRSHIATEHLNYIDNVDVLPTVDSTNVFLANQLQQQSKTLTKPPSTSKMNICIAEQQTAGRGRRGRHWVSSPNSNISFSVSWIFEQWHCSYSLLSLGVAVAISEALQSFNIDSQIKWPNDIYLDQRKLGGILIDSQTESTGQAQIIIGCGLNVQLEHSDKNSIDQEVIDLNSYQQSHSDTINSNCLNRNNLIGAIINHLVALLTSINLSNINHYDMLERIHTLWKQRALYLNQNVAIISKDDHRLIIKGRFIDINPNGLLIIETDSGKRYELADSDVTLRLF